MGALEIPPCHHMAGVGILPAAANRSRLTGREGILAARNPLRPNDDRPRTLLNRHEISDSELDLLADVLGNDDLSALADPADGVVYF
ncbi:MAG: hypothetical protein ACRD3N_00325 [Terracidiphilus sp.]